MGQYRSYPDRKDSKGHDVCDWPVKFNQVSDFCWCYSHNVHYECLFRGLVWNNLNQLCRSNLIKSSNPQHILTKLEQDTDNLKAVIALAKFHQYGCLGLAVDNAKVLLLYENAVKLGNPFAMNNLAYAYHNGELGVAANHTEALSLYRIAIKLNNSSAMVNLAFAYESGHLGLAVDNAKALSLYESAVKLHNSSAIVCLAIAHNRGQLDLPANDAAALLLCRQAVELGCCFAMVIMAIVYEYGQLGFAVDNAKALSLYQKAVKLGSSLAIECCIKLLFRDDNLNSHTNVWLDWMVVNYGLLHERLSGKQSDQIGKILANNLDIHVLAEHVPGCLDKETMQKIARFRTNRHTHIIRHAGVIFDVANIINNYA